MKDVTRRQFVGASAAAAVSLAAARTANAASGSAWLYLPRTSGVSAEPDFHALVARAAEAAKRAGADYADARITLTRQQQVAPMSENERHAFGVRALVKGYWGFLASTVWTPDEAVRLAQGAVAQANARRQGKTRPIEWGTVPPVRGEWRTPIEIDPFDIPIEEKLDVLNAFTDMGNTAQVGVRAFGALNFQRKHEFFASSEDSAWAQTTYLTGGMYAVTYRDEYHAGLRSGGAAADFLGTAGRGWEYITGADIAGALPGLIDEAEQSRHRTPVDIGRYDMVFTAEAMTSMLDATLGAATELDRALGYEANASGTSYLDDPLAMVGTERVASPLVTVTGNRSLPDGAATVRWDNDGVVPDDFTLVADGVLVDFQTSREQAAWLAPYYQRIGKPVRSHGCANASSALDLTMQHSPNIALLPGKAANTFESMVAGMKKGVAVMDLRVSMDQQQLNGLASGTMREIVRGKLGRIIEGGALAFRAPEFWKSITAVGGAGTQRWFGASRRKGEPVQITMHSVGTVPVTVPQLGIIDVTRKA